MEVTGERRIPASRERVWQALHDPAVLRVCLPGCESLVQESADTMALTSAGHIGPIHARFSGRLQFSDLDPPGGLRVAGEGQGGVAGFAKGETTIRLADAAPFTVLTYAMQAQAGGKIAQLGARVVDASGRRMADQFFDRFMAEVGGAPDTEIAAAGPAGGAAAAVNAPARTRAGMLAMLAMLPREPYGLPLVAWGGMAIYAALFLAIFLL